MTVHLIDAPKSVVAAQAELKRRDPDQLHGMIEDMVKVLETAVQADLRRGKYPDRKTSQKVAELMHAVARDLEI
jgi:CspA family cold shock protein